MPIVLYRVDERLIHGQVVLAWGSRVRPQQYVVVDDELATSDWEQELYRIGAGDVEVTFVSVADARSALERWRSAAERTVLLTRDIGSMLRLAAGGALRGEHVNLGGIHHGPGRTETLRYLHLTDEDRADLHALEAEGVEVSAQDLPDSADVPLHTLLES